MRFLPSRYLEHNCSSHQFSSTTCPIIDMCAAIVTKEKKRKTTKGSHIRINFHTKSC